MPDASTKGPSPETVSLILGALLSIAGGLHKAFDAALALECRALQIFTKNASTWKERALSKEEIRSFDLARKQSGIHRIAAHAAYLLNICSPDREIQQKSIHALECELQRCEELAIPWLVLHPGAHKGKGESTGIANAVDVIERVFRRVRHSHTRLLLETTAGQGSDLGKSFE
jgi:deoxyribonuclease-4